ncbi:hypothetical protein ACIQNI_22715 [Streptomyces sp. NPDC091266]|uniref:hypothetical protein n=1 Tax=Streptomyces sp. NPDC091266 TaxID=3365978 RepID=UPI00381287EA
MTDRRIQIVTGLVADDRPLRHRSATARKTPAQADPVSPSAANTLDSPTTDPLRLATAPATTRSPLRPLRKNVPASSSSSARKGPPPAPPAGPPSSGSPAHAAAQEASAPASRTTSQRTPSTGVGAGSPAGRWIHCASNRTLNPAPDRSSVAKLSFTVQPGAPVSILASSSAAEARSVSVTASG